MPEFIALRRMKVQRINPDGTAQVDRAGRPLTRECQPGDPCPEANFWKNVSREIAAGRLGIKDIPLTGHALGTVMQTQAKAAPKPTPAAQPAPPSEGEASEQKAEAKKAVRTKKAGQPVETE